jgi:uncharacterized protein (DUF2062 family)
MRDAYYRRNRVSNSKRAPSRRFYGRFRQHGVGANYRYSPALPRIIREPNFDFAWSSSEGYRESRAPANHASSKPLKAFHILKQFVKRNYERLKQIRDAPRAVAGGAAIGTFWGFTPLLGLKTLLSILFAWIFRCSKISAAVAVSIQDILTPVWPVILRWEYDLGFWILSHPHHFPKRFREEDAHLRSWLHWRTLEILWPTLVGSLLFAAPLAVISYWAVERSLKRYERRRRGRLEPRV